jgi:hypothetical protein
MKIVHTLEKKIDARYIAGYIDGEGCIRATLAKNKKNASGLHVFITNTYLPFLLYLEQKYGGRTSIRNKSNPKHRTIYQWRLCNRVTVKKFLSDILPFLVEKKEQALIALEYCDLPVLKANSYSSSWSKTLEARNKRIQLAEQLKSLKKPSFDDEWKQHTKLNQNGR